ncbi:class I SAM-dependent methyltransferase [Hymenobacter ruricola]|uniref:Class I SAM-dependent methyltransferase n=1 Tax=Hymenobacter ruricola TaxID=2791023 RepID=A0ABS0I730_9BACT|nr:class I SAM-dependent methyltransferase [Hymenobacter ruricola]MBF9222493.1 class I SAM-dependent methyltransferase [Hymenobacter ruricola]
MKLVDFVPLFQACTTPDKLDSVLDNYGQELTKALFAVDVENPVGLLEISQCFFAFKLCPAFEELESTEQFPAEVTQALILFATTFERAGSFALITPIRAILPPNASVSLRFRAQELIHGLLDIRSGYATIFPLVMDLLLQAQYEEDEDYSSSVVQVAYKFLKEGRSQLRKYNFLTEEIAFTELFSRPSNTHSYPFLAHPAIESLLIGKASGSLTIVIEPDDVPTPVLFPTEAIQRIFRQYITIPVDTDPRTRGNDYRLGYSHADIRERILNYGRADFREACLTVRPVAQPVDRVLLYCFYNLRKHFFTTRYVFGQIIDSLPDMLTNKDARPVFVDLGCGPMTSGLALADLYQERHGHLLTVNYVGIDIAPAMIEKAQEFERSGLFAPNSQFAYYEAWADALVPIIDGFVQVTNPIIFNASYLFASESLNVSELALFINQLRGLCPESKMYFVFQNPNRADRNQKYVQWKEQVRFTRSIVQSVREVRYKNNPASVYEPTPEEVAYELLAFQPD